MSVVLSKLRTLSERTGVPYPTLTRSVACTLFTVYAARLSYPYLSPYLFPEASRNVKKIPNETFHINKEVVDKEDDQQESSKRPCNLITPNMDILTSIVANYRRKVTDTRTPSERYLEFGPPRTNPILARLEELIVKFLYSIRNLTGINVDFVVQLVKLLRIMIPKMASTEVLLLVAHTCSLMARTFLSVYVAHLEGQVVKYIVRRDLAQFAALLSRWLLIAVPATFLNSLIRFLESRLALAFRSRLVDYAYKLYFTNETYYSVSNLDGRLENVDHSLTDDITTFAQHCAHLYSSVTKPLLDVGVILITLFKMARSMGSWGVPGPLLAGNIVLVTHLILRQCSPQFGKLVSEEARRKGYLRYVHSRVITNSEEIGFYRGGHIERTVLERAFALLVGQMNVIATKRLWYVMLEQLLMKYLWSATGMIVIAMPVMLSDKRYFNALVPTFLRTFLKSHDFSSSMPVALTVDDISDRTEYMTTAKNILVSGSDALERLLSSYKEVTELAGYTERVAKMFTVFEQVARGEFRRDSIVVKANGTSSMAITKGTEHKKDILSYDDDGRPLLKGMVVEVSGHILLENVPVVTPNCDVVVRSLSLKIPNSMHLLITGPNGCGKSSLFRILAGLWPIFGGRLERPPPRDMFYIPQRPYMSLGTLRDQLIYPDEKGDMAAKGLDDGHLELILDRVHLRQIVTREGGWEALADWKDILSGGEKQRMGMARLFYHRPQFALLDECTSAVSIDVEAEMYETAKSLGISLITITHRPSLWKFHTHLLQFDGEGGYRFRTLDACSSHKLAEESEL